MPLHIIRQDITKLSYEAIVNPTDRDYSGSGGTDLAIHRAAGPLLEEECRRHPPLSVGSVEITKGYGLSCRYIFHTVGPVWKGGQQNEEALLRGCYLNALLKAAAMGLHSIAFPLISSGTFGFPKESVLRIASNAISDFLYTTESELQVFICILDRDAYKVSSQAALQQFINRRNIPSFCDAMPSVCECMSSMKAPIGGKNLSEDLAQWIGHQDDSFAVMLLKLIDKKGMTDVQCYKKANVTKGTFWKINNDPKYRPSKQTVLAFAIALELNMEETERLLKTVGFALSDSNTFDRIIQFYITEEIYDIFEINAALFQYDQVCLGC